MSSSEVLTSTSQGSGSVPSRPRGRPRIYKPLENEKESYRKGLRVLLPDSHALSEEEQYLLIQKIAHFEPWSEIQIWLTEAIKKPISYTAYLHYRHSPKWQAVLKKYRDEYTAKILDVPLANKRKRLDELQIIYDQVQWASSRTERLHSKVSFLKVAASILDQARIEVEGQTKDGRPNLFITQFNQMTDKEIDERRQELMDQVRRLTQNQRRAGNASEERGSEETDGDCGTSS